MVQEKSRWLACLWGLALLGACSTSRPRLHSGWSPAELQVEQDCENGSVPACGLLGKRMLERATKNGTEQDRQRGLVLLEVACGHEDGPSCTSLGRAYSARDPAPSAMARAKDVLSGACTRRHGEACTALGQIILVQAPLTDPAIAKAWQSACELGDGQGCELLGRLETEDSSTREAATAHLSMACAMGRLTSCHARAALESGDPAQRALAAQHLADNCQRGFAPSCTQLALLSAPLVSPHSDCARAMALGRQACAGRDDIGCTIVDACDLVARPQEAATLDRLHRSCSPRAPLACLYWAEAKTAAGVEDRRDVRDAYQWACHSEYSGVGNLACVRLATLDLARAQTVTEAGYAIGLLRRACDQSSGEACCRLADIVERGTMVTPDVSEAARLRSKACELGHLGCCKAAHPSPSAPGTPTGPRG